jgi:hypothetical protein
MNAMTKHFIYFIFMTALLGMTACSSTGDKHAADDKNTTMETADTQQARIAAMEIYEIHHDGRINVFYDRKLCQEFLELGETSFRLTHIGAGPNGETVVYGLTKHDKKKPDSVEALKVYEEKSLAPANFYAEMHRHGRIYVFDNLEDMKPVRQFGHPNFFYMEVGAGPKGETVVFVLNEKTKKKRPDDLIAKYKAMNTKT